MDPLSKKSLVDYFHYIAGYTNLFLSPCNTQYKSPCALHTMTSEISLALWNTAHVGLNMNIKHILTCNRIWSCLQTDDIGRTQNHIKRYLWSIDTRRNLEVIIITEDINIGTKNNMFYTLWLKYSERMFSIVFWTSSSNLSKVRGLFEGIDVFIVFQAHSIELNSGNTFSCLFWYCHKTSNSINKITLRISCNKYDSPYELCFAKPKFVRRIWQFRCISNFVLSLTSSQKYSSLP